MQYGDFEKEAHLFLPVFEMLRQFDPGMVFNGDKPALLGFERKGTAIVDLEEEVYSSFPSLKYEYDGTRPILELNSVNPELFYENSRKA